MKIPKEYVGILRGWWLSPRGRCYVLTWYRRKRFPTGRVLKTYIEHVHIDGDVYQVDMLPITPVYDEQYFCPSKLVVEQLTDGSYWIMQVDNIHDVDQQAQYNIIATSNEADAEFCQVPLLPKP